MFDGQEQKHKSAANFSIILFFVFRLCDDFPNLKDKETLFSLQVYCRVQGQMVTTLKRFLTSPYFP